MRISTEEVFLALLGFLHFRRADGMNLEEQMALLDGMDQGDNRDHYTLGERRIRIILRDGCMDEGDVIVARVTSTWLLPNQPHPVNIFPYFMVMGKEQYRAGPFAEFHVHERQWLLPDNHIFVAMPADKVYSALLEPQGSKKDIKKHNSNYPGKPPKRGKQSQLDSYLQGKYGFH
ncbi:uncharacterized protein LOC117170063 [Belonocnema kinseyi]|uniref:uncharacterized protein LOC117170063 n=1 Tax=Belonocnema kinseyi TaxID=2817044 RepID=UPI00143D39CC|nr:uncharacterized protein LOC117170063 [Belonocnema kinseyi]